MVTDVEMGSILLGFAKDSPDSPLTGVAEALSTLLTAAGITEET